MDGGWWVRDGGWGCEVGGGGWEGVIDQELQLRKQYFQGLTALRGLLQLCWIQISSKQNEVQLTEMI